MANFKINPFILKFGKNTFWLFLEKIVRIALGVFVTILIAKKIGPENFGVLSFAIAFVAILSPLVDFGLNGIIVKEFFNKSKLQNTIFGTSVLFKLGIGVFVFLILLTLSQFINFSNADLSNSLILILSTSLLFQAANVIEFWFESKVKVKYIAISKSIIFVFVSLLKLYVIFFRFNFLLLAGAFAIEYFLNSVSFFIIYYLNGGKTKLWNFDKVYLKKITKKSLPLFFSGFAAILYLKIDQIMLGKMSTPLELGVYSAAVKLSESWYFIPTLITTSLFPAILSAKKKSKFEYYKRIQRLSDLMLTAALIIAVITTLYSELLVDFIYGSKYLGASLILKIHVWAGIFIFLRSIFSKWILAEGKYIYSYYSQVTGAIINILLNYFLIPKYGGIGAAYATIISYGFSSILILPFLKGTKDLMLVYLKSFLFHTYISFFFKKSKSFL